MMVMYTLIWMTIKALQPYLCVTQILLLTYTCAAIPLVARQTLALEGTIDIETAGILVAHTDFHGTFINICNDKTEKSTHFNIYIAHKKKQ